MTQKGDQQRTPPSDTQVDRIMKKEYYDKGITLGRDALFHHLMKQYPKKHPSIRQVNDWLKKQKIQQIFAQTRKGGTSEFFTPSSPWQHIAVDLIVFEFKPSNKQK